MASHGAAVPGTHPGTDHQVESGHNHPTEGFYIRIALILTAITGIEVLIYYIEALESVLVPALFVMSIGKFVMVIAYFMHLKFDDRRLTWVFLGGLALALAVFIVVFAVMRFDDLDLHTVVDTVAPVLPE